VLVRFLVTRPQRRGPSKEKNEGSCTRRRRILWLAHSLHLSDAGHDVTIVDNLSRREIDIELEVESLTPIDRSANEFACGRS